MRTQTAWLVCLIFGCLVLVLLTPIGAHIPAVPEATAAPHDAPVLPVGQCAAPLPLDAAALETSTTETGTLRGDVRSEAGEPRADVTVIAEGPWGMRQGTTSDATGAYAFDALPAGRYTLRAFDSDSAELTVVSSATVAIAADAEAELLLRVADEQPTEPTASEQARLAQTGSGSISGRVTAEDTGLPLSDVDVMLYRVEDARLRDVVYPDENGNYELTGVDNGTYRLLFNPAAFDATGDASGYAFEYYTDATTFAEATDLVVNDNAVTDINVVLSPGSFITGVVTAADTGLPLDDVRVQAYADTAMASLFAYTDETGTYSITNLRAGAYTVNFVPPQAASGSFYAAEYYNNQYTEEAADPVLVAAAAVTPGIDAALEQSGTLSGVVTAEDTGAPLEDVRVLVYDSEGESVASDATDSTGTYSITGLLPVDYRIKFAPLPSGPSAFYLDEYHENKETFEAADPVNVPLTTNVTINAALAKGGIISGQVTGNDGTPLEYVAVTIYTPVGGFVDIDGTDSTGTYSITGLLPADYRILFNPLLHGLASFYLEEYYDDAATFGTATPVSVQADTTVTANAELTRGGTIAGRVTDAATGEGIQDVDFRLYDDQGNRFYYSSSGVDPDGTYIIKGLPAGSYYLVFHGKGNYQDYIYNNQSQIGLADPIAIAAGEDKTDINAALSQGGGISGRVTAADTGNGLANVDVDIFDYCTGARRGYTMTDETGAYAIYTLPAGLYVVLFDTDFTDAEAYVGEYYNDMREGGTAISVTASTMTEGIDAELTRGGVLSGTITAEDTGEPLENVRVNPDGANETTTNYISAVRTDATGAYQIVGLPADEYRILFDVPSEDEASRYLNEYYDNQPDELNATWVSVALGEEVPGIDAALSPGATIAGVVTAEADGTPLEDVDVEVRTPDGEWIADTITDAAGTYRTPGLTPGDYIIRYIPDTDTSYMAEYYNNVFASSQAVTITVSGTEEVTGIDAALAPGSAISGRVTASDTGGGLDNVRVSVSTVQGDFFGEVWTERDGSYRMGGLPAGDYIVRFAWSDAYLSEYYTDQPDAASATPVSVTLDQETTGIDAVLTLGGSITGRVTSALNSAGLYFVRVELFDSDNNFVDAAYSNEFGLYSFEKLTADSYKLYFRPADNRCTPLLEEYYNDKLDIETADAVTVTLGATTEVDEVVLAGTGFVSGRVTAEDTEAGLADVQIEIYNYDTKDTVVVTATTDAAGNYTTPALPDGFYSIHFVPPDSGPASGYLAEYYDNKPTLEEANGFEVRAPNVTPINAVLVAGARITGTVTAEDTSPGIQSMLAMEGVLVEVYDSTSTMVTSTETAADGSYATRALPNGEYRLGFVPPFGHTAEYYNDKATLEAADVITVAAPDDTTGIDGVLAVSSEPGVRLYLPLLVR